MKKFLAAFAAALIILLPVAFPKAASTASVNLSVDKQDVKINDIVTVTVKAENITDVFGIDLVINYDGTTLNYVEKSIKSPIMSALGTQTGTNTVRFLASKIGDVSGSSGSVTLATLKFTAVKEGKATISLGKVDMSDSKTNTIAASTGSGVSINILQQAAAPDTAKTTTTTQTSAPAASQTQTKAKTETSSQTKTSQQTQTQASTEVQKAQETKSATEQKAEASVQEKSDAVKPVSNENKLVESDNKTASGSSYLVIGLLIGGIVLLSVFDVLIFLKVTNNKKMKANV